LASSITTAALIVGPAGVWAQDKLTIGSTAPALDIQHWISNGQGKFKPVTKFENGKVYVVEFWATWCGPCIASMPHISELQQQYKEKGVTICGVNIWEEREYNDETLKKVTDFVEKKGDGMGYTVVYDGAAKHMDTNWMKAAGRNGIPCAFVVTKGKIGWIGHPAQLNQKLLDSILDGTFDVAAAAKAEEAKAAVGKYFSEHVVPKIQSRDFSGAISALEEMKKEFPGEEKTINMHIKRLQDQLSKTKPESK
jgi:thiol-disulfide isomerase/thioredoxin